MCFSLILLVFVQWSMLCRIQAFFKWRHFDQWLTQNQSDSQLFIGKNVFLEKKLIFWGIKQSTSWYKLKKMCFLQNFAANFLIFCTKNAENDYFDQHLECAAPKRWLKYTTSGCFSCLPYCYAENFCSHILIAKYYRQNLRLDSNIESKSSNNTFLNIIKKLFLL